MKKDTQEKSLVKVNENNIFHKIKCFFKDLFYKNNFNKIDTPIVKNNNDILKDNEPAKSSFKEYIKNIENEETKLIKLQKQYRSGEIKEEELTEEQCKSLCDLYDKQIANLKKSNEIRKQKLLEYRKRLQTEN